MMKKIVIAAICGLCLCAGLALASNTGVDMTTAGGFIINVKV